MRSAAGRYREAEPLLIESLAIREALFGPEDTEVASVLNNLGDVYRAENRFVKAEPLLRRAAAIWEKTAGPAHPDYAVALNNLAAVYYQLGYDERAKPLFNRALAIWERALGPDHPHTVTMRQNLAEAARGRRGVLVLGGANPLNQSRETGIRAQAVVDGINAHPGGRRPALQAGFFQQLDGAVVVAQAHANDGLLVGRDVGAAGQFAEHLEKLPGLVRAPVKGVGVAESAQSQGAAAGQLAGALEHRNGLVEAAFLGANTAQTQPSEGVIGVQVDTFAELRGGAVVLAGVIVSGAERGVDEQRKGVELDGLAHLDDGLLEASHGGEGEHR